MPEIFDYNDYRVFLKDHYEEEKKVKTFFSYRYISSKTGLNPGLLIRIMQGKVHLPLKYIPIYADFYKFYGKRREYWHELVLFGRAKLDSEVYMRFERLQTIRGVHLARLVQDQMLYLNEWRHNAIRSLLGISALSSPEQFELIGQQLTPQCTTKQVAESIELLERLGMIGQDENGVWQVSNVFITAGGESQKKDVRVFQTQVMQLGIESLERHAPPDRDISTVTVTLNRMDLPVLKERIQAFRQEVFRLSTEGDNDDMVLQLNIQLFPVALLQNQDGH
jgi:uncharacterized protein (TIGR02147 family)